MILFYNRTKDIQVIRTKTDRIPVVNYGTILRRNGCAWEWDAPNTSCLDSDTVDDAEKREIIGMLDKLNDVQERDDSKMQSRWKEITGLKGATL